MLLSPHHQIELSVSLFIVSIFPHIRMNYFISFQNEDFQSCVRSLLHAHAWDICSTIIPSLFCWFSILNQGNINKKHIKYFFFKKKNFIHLVSNPSY